MKEQDFPLDSEEFHKAYRVAYLIKAYIQKNLGAGEREELDAWLEESDQNLDLFEDLTDKDNQQKALDWFAHLQTKDAYKRLQKRIPFVQPERKSRPRMVAVSGAASVVILASFIAFFIIRKAEHKVTPVAKNSVNLPLQPQDILPAGNKATLKLSNGQKIALDSAAAGSLATEGNAQIIKLSGALTYEKQEGGTTAQPVLNELTTPKGGQYAVTLSDGTKVWLNAASSLKYPAVFTGTERAVTLTGEGYFEVAHSSIPFKVKMDGYEVEDLGTAFNINAYKDEGVDKATLMEGAIIIIKDGHAKALKPGETATITTTINVEKADVEAVAGWRNSKFVYRFTPMKTVLLDMERWYNISIQNKESNQHHLKATIDRAVPLSKMLRILEGSGEIRFRQNGAELIVLP